MSRAATRTEYPSCWMKCSATASCASISRSVSCCAQPRPPSPRPPSPQFAHFAATASTRSCQQQPRRVSVGTLRVVGELAARSARHRRLWAGHLVGSGFAAACPFFVFVGIHRRLVASPLRPRQCRMGNALRVCQCRWSRCLLSLGGLNGGTRCFEFGNLEP